MRRTPTSTRLAPPERHLAEAAAALAARRLPAAEALLRERLARAPQDVGALRLLAEVAAEREDYVEAERLLGECLTLAPGLQRRALDLARVLHSQQKAAPMLPLLERLLALEPDSFRFRTLQASAYNLLGDRTTARGRSMSALLTEFPDNELLWLYYGHSLRIAGRARRGDRRLPQERATEAAVRRSLVQPRESQDGALQRRGHRQRCRRRLRARDLDDNNRLHFEFALGKAFEDAARLRRLLRALCARQRAAARAWCTTTPRPSRASCSARAALYTPEFFADARRQRQPGARPDLHRRTAALRLDADRADSRQPLAGGRHARAAGHPRLRPGARRAGAARPAARPTRSRSRA